MQNFGLDMGERKGKEIKKKQKVLLCVCNVLNGITYCWVVRWWEFLLANWWRNSHVLGGEAIGLGVGFCYQTAQACDVFTLKEGDHSKFAWLECREDMCSSSIKREGRRNSCVCFNLIGVKVYVDDSSSSLFAVFDSFLFCLVFSIQVGKQRLVGLCRDGWKEGMSVKPWILWVLMYFVLCNHLYLSH